MIWVNTSGTRYEWIHDDTCVYMRWYKIRVNTSGILYRTITILWFFSLFYWRYNNDNHKKKMKKNMCSKSLFCSFVDFEKSHDSSPGYNYIVRNLGAPNRVIRAPLYSHPFPDKTSPPTPFSFPSQNRRIVNFFSILALTATTEKPHKNQVFKNQN